MKLHALERLLFLVVISAFLLPVTVVFASNTSQIQVTLQRPVGTMKMGETPAFIGTVTNVGKTSLKGVVVYLSLVSLEPGNEHPVDLEDWSAEKAVRIDRLSPGGTSTHQWSMRLIQAGRFGVALTVVDPREKRPIVSEIVPFDIQPKPTLVSKRILPVAIGEPLLLLTLLGFIGFSRGRLKISMSKALDPKG